MTPETTIQSLKDLFPAAVVRNSSPNAWQVEQDSLRLLAVFSEDNAWLHLLVPIAPLSEAKPYLAQILEANFETTQAVRYALSEEVIWGVFQYRVENLDREDFEGAIAQLISLHKSGLSPFFQQSIQGQLRQIVYAAKLQGQTLEATLQNIERFYAEGVMGDMQQPAAEREQFIAAWRAQLQRFWEEE
ncbi:hypothetical protein [Oscillatoria sp. FACHB-1406]|uniref:hypothetical protein n=1 Tax=Oscillatoria sp. FACHB-1406 TaxID=2692846 RepID=UPI0016843855|nr:hypothetical protein [Oscillatoria sp. FACHB-1406]MBD2579795.1 hypothetical protein [Oscillatoria sp. FACHB-1406]